MKIELKPCPFCGGKAKFLIKYTSERGFSRGFVFGICCSKCDVTTARTDYALMFQMGANGEIEITTDERPLAAEAWNRRG